MSTKTIGVVGRGSGWEKVGIELGLYVFHPNSSQPGMFQTFAQTILTSSVKAILKDMINTVFLGPSLGGVRIFTNSGSFLQQERVLCG